MSKQCRVLGCHGYEIRDSLCQFHGHADCLDCGRWLPREAYGPCPILPSAVSVLCVECSGQYDEKQLLARCGWDDRIKWDTPMSRLRPASYVVSETERDAKRAARLAATRERQAQEREDRERDRAILKAARMKRPRRPKVRA